MFIPHTTKETEEMLKVVGVSNLDELFNDIPINYRFPDLDLPPAQSEMEILSELQELSTGNESCRDLACFLGAGSYNHYIPAVVDSILRRSEFYTAYTPYQPEVSQGTLQAIFEFQSLIASLTGMDASNASHYDGATATAEAVIMAYHHFRSERNKIILTRGVNPQFRDVIRTYTKGYQELTLVGDDPLYGTELGSVKDLFDRQTALIIVQYPDFLGRMLDYTQLVDFAHAQGALVAIIVNPVTLGLLKTPGDFNADIAIGEGQPLGISMSFGGPYLGFFATRKELIRKISGRLVGQTQDASGKRGYVLTLTAREQHIRRERATYLYESGIDGSGSHCLLKLTRQAGA
jgi:glycine dehydrogenase subunit 1